MFLKIGFFKNSQISQENTCVGDFFLIKLPGGLQLYYKTTPTQMFSWL